MLDVSGRTPKRDVSESIFLTARTHSNLSAPLEGTHSPAAHHCHFEMAVAHERDEGQANVGCCAADSYTPGMDPILGYLRNK